MADTQVLTPSGYKLRGVRDNIEPLYSSEDDLKSQSNADSPLSASYTITQCNVRHLLQEGIAPDSQNLLLPPGLVDDVTNAVWRLAVDEPCGFRGCVLSIVLCNDANDSDPKKRRPLLQLMNNTVITHKITILLYPDTNSWFTKMARLFRPKHTAVASHFSSEVTRMCSFD